MFIWCSSVKESPHPWTCLQAINQLSISPFSPLLPLCPISAPPPSPILLHLSSLLLFGLFSPSLSYLGLTISCCTVGTWCCTIHYYWTHSDLYHSFPLTLYFCISTCAVILVTIDNSKQLISKNLFGILLISVLRSTLPGTNTPTRKCNIPKKLILTRVLFLWWYLLILHLNKLC